MAKRVRRNFKRYYDKNEVRYRPVFCFYRIIGDYRFFFETAYIKERFVPTYPSSHTDHYKSMKAGGVFSKMYIEDGEWIFEAAMTKQEAFVDAL